MSATGDPVDESVDGRIREILAAAKACRSEREMKAARAIWQAARESAIEECAVLVDGIAQHWLNKPPSHPPRTPEPMCYGLSMEIATKIRSMRPR